MKKDKLTKQGVRDLGNNNRKAKTVEIPKDCDHKRMKVRRRGERCECPDCGLVFDEELYGV